MTIFFRFTFVGLCIFTLYSCKKDNKGGGVSNNPSPYSSLIVGKWLAVKSHVKVYIQQGPLVKDTTENITGAIDNAAWYEVYNADNSGYKIYLSPVSNTPLADTSLVYKYYISNTTLSLLPKGDGAYNENIVAIDSTSMELTNTYVSNIQNPNWQLNPSTTYQFVEETYYMRQ